MTISISEDTSLSSPNHRVFTVDFHGTPVATTVTSSPKIVRIWLRTTLHFRRHHRHHLVVGLGVQWRPAFRSGEDTQAATLQLCVGRRCLIFQLIHSDTVPNFLRRFLINPNHTFVGMWNHSDAKSLMNSKHELYMLCGPLDLRLYAVSKATGRSLTQESRDTIVKECLGEGVEFDRWISRSEWDDEELSLKQILQACVEAYASFEIGKDLRAWEL